MLEYSYIEGIQVLYKTNTIHMSGRPLLSPHLPQLLLPQRLRDITSIEIAVPLEFTLNNKQDLILGGNQIENVLEVLSRNLPNLTRLHLGLTSRYEIQRPVDAEAFFQPLDAFASRQSTRLEHFAVSTAVSVFYKLLDVARSQIKNEQGIETEIPSCMPDELWRNLDGTYVMVPIPGEGSVFQRMRSPYPKPPLGPTAPGGAQVRDGYWVLYGNEEGLDPRSVSCFGSSAA